VSESDIELRMFVENYLLAAVIYPSLSQLEGNLIDFDEKSKRSARSTDILSRKRVDEKRRMFDKDFDRDDECGICLEPGTKMVLPTCGHCLCIRCFHDWYVHISS